jgi:hypothetical protein
MIVEDFPPVKNPVKGEEEINHEGDEEHEEKKRDRETGEMVRTCYFSILLFVFFLISSRSS